MATYDLTLSGGVTLSELNMYGSSRLGTRRPELDLTTATLSDSWTLYRGDKSFELSNHLGNVLSVVSDNRAPIFASSTITGYNADVLQAQDYYPFGMTMPGRKYNSGVSKNRFGFNGQEMDNEVSGEGNSYTAMFWQYDSRLGRRWNLDPVVQISISDYAVFGNNPIMNIDPDGNYFFGIFGSTREQRDAAKKHASKVGGSVNYVHKKNINVSYEVKLGGAESSHYMLVNQYFNKDGSFISLEPELKDFVPDFYDKWNASENFLAEVSYKFIDDLWLFTQSNPFGALIWDKDERSHLDGTAASQREVEDGLVAGLTLLAPGPKMLNTIPKGVSTLKVFNSYNAAQFSKLFKGTFVARLPSATKGQVNKLFNIAGNMLNGKERTAAMGITKQFMKLLPEDEKDENVSSDTPKD